MLHEAMCFDRSSEVLPDPKRRNHGNGKGIEHSDYAGCQTGLVAVSRGSTGRDSKCCGTDERSDHKPRRRVEKLNHCQVNDV